MAKLVQEALKRSSTQGPSAPPSEAIRAEYAATSPSNQSKLHDFWTSTPSWAAVGAMIGALASNISLWLIVVAAWVIVCIDFIRVGFFSRGWRRNTANVVIPLALACLFFEVAKIAPRAASLPALDAYARTTVDAFAQRFPWLKNAPKSDTTGNQQNPSSQPAPAAHLLNPDFSIEPTSVEPPKFMFKANNKSSTDLENIFFDIDYFIAEKKKGSPNSSVIFRRYFTVSGKQLLPNDDMLLRQNKSFSFSVDFCPSHANEQLFITSLMLPEDNLMKLAGFRVTIRYDRYLDHKSFSYNKSYAVSSKDGFNTASGLDAGTRMFSYPMEPDVMLFGEILPYISDSSKWRDDILHVVLSGQSGRVQFMRGK
jgi:hypothetical protein